VENEPWTLAKDPANSERLNYVLYSLLETLRVVAVLISPFIPGSAEKMMAQLGITNPEHENFDTIRTWGRLAAGQTLKRGEALFPRVDYKPDEGAVELKAVPPPPPIKPEISYEDFEKIDLRVARILEAEAVPKSAKLLKLKIDIGEERTVVAGIAKDYKPEQLVGKTIVIVANLKPAKLMGIESRGMLLATDATAGGITILAFDREPDTGAKVR